MTLLGLVRQDGKCGPQNLIDGKPGQCNPYGNSPCCSPKGYCGITVDHCRGIDYRVKDLVRKDGRCGPDFPINGKPGQCSPYGNSGWCCSPHAWDYRGWFTGGWCGSSWAHCKCANCIDYRKSVQVSGTFTYRHFDTPKTWSEAKAACESEEAGTLAIPQEKLSYSGNYWIGLSKHSGAWKTTCGASPSYTNWADGQPYNSWERCALRDARGGWYNYPCSSRYNYVCQYRTECKNSDYCVHSLDSCKEQACSAPTCGKCKPGFTGRKCEKEICADAKIDPVCDSDGKTHMTKCDFDVAKLENPNLKIGLCSWG